MKLLSVLLVAFAGAAVAKEHHGRNSTGAQCRKMFRLERLEKLASNDTLLARVTKNDTAKAQKIKDEAKKEETVLKDLQANSTLQEECPKVRAVIRSEHSCAKMVGLQHLMKLVANQTALDAKTKGNSTKADKLKKAAEDHKAELQSLEANSTLTQFCSVFEDRVSCHAMRRLQREVDHAKNDTFLQTKFGGNSTKIDKFKAKAAKAEKKLNSMMSNNTLMDFCKTLASNRGNGGTSGETGPSIGGAAGLQAMGLTASILALFTAGLLVL